MLRYAVPLLALPLLSGCYLVEQGVGQAELLLRREPLERVAARPETPEATRAKLALIGEAKAYAEREIGLKPTNNYEDWVALDRDAVSYVVSAAPKDRLEAHTWWFPIVGRVPYKGFFDKADAERERRALEAKGLDTVLRGVPAFSTLGWLPDPVYSPFLRYERQTLANVVIHELTHVTLYLAGQASFNEGFATFVGNVGAEAFLSARFGRESAEAAAARAAVRDNAVFTEFVQDVSVRLERLYAREMPREAKLAERERVFAWAKARFETDYAPRMQTHQFRHFPTGRFNNAALISYRTYYNRLDRFEAAHRKLGGDLKQTVAFFRDTVAKEKEPEAFLDRFVAR